LANCNPKIETCSFEPAGPGVLQVNLIITTGTFNGVTFEESHRWTMDIADDALISNVLEQVKKECVPSVPVPNLEIIKPHLNLMLAETFERLDIEDTIKDYSLGDGSILHLMSAVR
jgi:hypothetical protein